MNEDGGMADGVTTVWTGGRKDDTSVVAYNSKKMGKFSRVRINGDLLRQLQEAFSHEAPDVDSSTHQESPPVGDIVVDEVCLESEATPVAGGTALAWMEDEGIAEVTSPTSSSSSTPSTENPEWDFCDGTKDNEPQIPSCEWRSPCSPSEDYIKDPSGVDRSDSAGDNNSLDIDVSLEIDQDEDEESTSSSSSISSDSGSGRSPDLLSEEGAIQAVTQCFSWLDHEVFSLEPLSTRAVISSASSGDEDLPQHEDEEEDEDDDEEECECDDLECEGDEGWEIDEEFEFTPDVLETGGGGQLGITAEDCDIGIEKQVTDCREFRRLSSPSATKHGLGNNEDGRSEINIEDQKTSKDVRVSVIATEDTLSDDTRHSGFMGTGNEEFSDASSVTWACVTNATTTSTATQPTATGIALDIDRGSEESGESLTESDWSDADTCILREPNPFVDDDDSGNDATDSDVDESLLDERPFEYADEEEEEEEEEEESCGMRQKEDLYSAYGTCHSNLYEDLWEERPDELYNNTYLATESPECDDIDDNNDDDDDDVSDADDITNDVKPRIFQAQGPYTNSPLRLRANKRHSAGGMAGTCLGCLVANDRNMRCYHRQTRIPSCAESRHYESLPCETVYSSEDSWLDSDNRRWYRIGTTVNNEETDFRIENGSRVDSRDVCNWESERVNIDTNKCHDYIDSDTLGRRNAKHLQNNSSIIVSPFHADIEREKDNATPNPCISVFVDNNYANCHEKMPPLDSIGRHSVPLESTMSEYQEDWHTPHGGEVNYEHYVNVSSPNDVCERCQEGYNFCNCGEKILPFNHLKCPTNCRTGGWKCSDGDLEAVNPDSDSDTTCDGDDDYDALDVNISDPENDGFRVLSASDVHPVTHHQNHNEMSSALAFDSLNFLPQYCSKRDHRQFRRKRKVSRRLESPPANGGGRESWSYNAPPQDGFSRTLQTIDNKQSSYKVSRPLAEVDGLEEDSSDLRQVSPLHLSPPSYDATHNLSIDDFITTTTPSSCNTTTTASNATNITTITHTNAGRNNSAPCTPGGYQYATGNNTEILLRTPLCFGNNDGHHRNSNDFSFMEDIKTTENHENNEAFRYTRSVNFPGTVTGRWETDGGIKTTCKNDGASEERYVAQEGRILVGKMRRNMDDDGDDGDSSSDNRELFGERKRQFERSQVLPECNRLHSNAAPVTRNDISNNNYLHSHDESGEFPGVAIGDEHHMTSGDYYADNYSGESYLNNGNSKSGNYFKPGRGGMVRAEEVVVGSRGVMVGSEVIGGFNALTTNLTAQSSASGVWSSGVTMEALENDRNRRLCAEHSLWPSGTVHSTAGCHLVDADSGRERMGVATGCQQSSGINGSCSSLHGEQIIRDYRCERSKCDTDCQSHGRRSRQKFWTAVKPAYHANCNHCDSGSVVINSESTLLGKEVTVGSMETGECDKWPSKKPSEVSLQRRLSIPAPCLSHSLCSRYPLYKKIQDILCFNHKPQTSNHVPSISPEELPSVVPPPPVLSQPKSVILEGDPLRGSSITHRDGESGVTACDISRVTHPVSHYNCHITQQPEGEKSTMTYNPGSGRAHLKSTISPSGKCNSRHWRSKVVGFAHREPPDGTATPAAPAVESKRTNDDDIRISEDLEPSREYKTSDFYAELLSDINSPEKVASSDRLAGSITHLQNSKDSDSQYESASLVSEVQNGLSSTTDSSFVKESPTSSERKLTSSDLKPQTHVSLSTAQQSSVSPSPAVIGERSSRSSKTVIPEASSQQSSIFLAVDPATSSSTSTSTTAGHSSLVDLMKLSRYDGYITLPVTFAPCTPVESPDEIVAEPPDTLDDDASLSRPCEGEDVGETRPPEGTDGRLSVSTQVRVSLRKYCRKRKNGTKKMVIKFTLCLECAGCKEELVEGQALIALDQQWHIWCFKCAACSTVLHGEYMGKDGLPYCEKDYQAQFGVKCAYCNRFISGKVLQAGENHHFHPTCARCTKCGDPFGDGEEMYLQGTAIWHPRCGPGPTENGTVLNGSLSNGHHVNGEQKAERERDFDGMSSTASETQFSGPYRTCSPGLILREYKSSQSPVDITRIYTYSYLTVEPSMGYLKRPLDPYDRPPPKSPHFHRPPTDSRKLSLPKTSSRLGMRVLVDQMQTETPRPKSPHMNNEEPIALSHYPGGRKPESGIISRIERDDFPAPPYPYTDPDVSERRRRWSGSTKAVSIDETDEATEQEDSESIVDDPKLKREEQELSKIATGIGKVFLQQVKEREKIRAWKATHLDPRNASRSPAANREPGYKLRFESSLNASPSRMTDHTRPGYEDEEFDRGSSYRCSTGRSSATIPSYNAFRGEPKPGFGLKSSTLPAAGRNGGPAGMIGDYSFSGLGEKTQSTEFSSARSDVSAGSLTEADRSALNAELCASTTYSSGLRGYSSYSPHLRRSLPNMHHMSSEPPKIYPAHLLLVSNYRLPNDVDRCHLERHLSDTDFEMVFHMTRMDFYRLPEWRRNDLKRRAKLF